MTDDQETTDSQPGALVCVPTDVADKLRKGGFVISEPGQGNPWDWDLRLGPESGVWLRLSADAGWRLRSTIAVCALVDETNRDTGSKGLDLVCRDEIGGEGVPLFKDDSRDIDGSDIDRHLSEAHYRRGGKWLPLG